MQIPDSLGLSEARLVVFGEVHGTQQIPEFLNACVAAWADPIWVGLEMPNSALLDDAHPFWSGDDGRSSEAMMALVTSLDAMDHVSLFGFDEPNNGFREQIMADVIFEKLSEGQTWILTGNLHARKTVGTPWDENFVSMVCRLLSRGVELVSFDVRNAGGTAWVMTRDGVGPTELAGDVSLSEVGFHRCDDETFDGLFQVGPVSASAPFRKL